MIQAKAVADPSKSTIGTTVSNKYELPERPSLAPNVQAVGEMPETGFQQRQWLVLRGTQFLQLSELIYRIVEQTNGERTFEEIAQGVSDNSEWLITAEQVQHLILTKLVPLGLIATGADDATDGPATSMAQARAVSPLGVNMPTKVFGPKIIDPFTSVLQVLYKPILLIPLLVAITLAHAWLYFAHPAAVAEGSLQVLYNPGLLLVIIGIMIVAGVFHELGHASALRYGGGQVRSMGVGLYLMYPAFFTDVTDSYRLGRWARVRTDVGGFYFYLIFALGTIGAYVATGQKFLLLLVVLINLDIVRQLFIPFVRFDGYWALADLTGIPDFFSMMVPFVTSLLPVGKLKGTRLPPLKPWVKGVFILYITLTIPVLAFLFFLMIRSLPTLVGATWDSLLSQGQKLGQSLGAANYGIVLLLLLQLLVLLLPLGGIAMVLYATLRPLTTNLWNWSRPTIRRRMVGGMIAVAAVLLLAWLWTPQVMALTDAGPPGTLSFTVTQRNHVETRVSYPQSPPVGGNHAPVPQNCGYYDTPIASENGVHSMEHGAVWITYRPDLPQKDIEWLRGFAHSQSYILVSPYPGLQAPVVVSSWAHQLQLTSVSDPRLSRFVSTFRLSQKAPERGQPCSDGVGRPK